MYTLLLHLCYFYVIIVKSNWGLQNVFFIAFLFTSSETVQRSKINFGVYNKNLIPFRFAENSGVISDKFSIISIDRIIMLSIGWSHYRTIRTVTTKFTMRLYFMFLILKITIWNLLPILLQLNADFVLVDNVFSTEKEVEYQILSFPEVI